VHYLGVTKFLPTGDLNVAALAIPENMPAPAADLNTLQENTMLKAIFNWFSHKNPRPEAQAPAVQPEAAPYKVEAPAAVKPVAEAAPVAEVKPVSEIAPVAKKPAAIKAAAKPAAKKPAAKKPAVKRAPKKTS
jgi:hypothetical protein